MLSHICEAFNCTLEEAEGMNFNKVQAIMEYRNLLAARDQHNQDASKMTPSMMRLWREMTGALNG
tara:strand:+ start:633 stop:827 length:195 start_codon:yes stop_codon:yes gene_type:complete